MVRDIGIDVRPPEKMCDDPNCPWHGHLKVHGPVIEGIVVQDKMEKTVVVEREYLRFDKKYERYIKRKSRYHVHSPSCVDAKIGDKVKFMECKPIAKSVNFVVIEKLGKR